RALMSCLPTSLPLMDNFRSARSYDTIPRPPNSTRFPYTTLFRSVTALRPLLIREQPLSQLSVIENMLNERIRFSQPRERGHMLHRRVSRSGRRRVTGVPVTRL